MKRSSLFKGLSGVSVLAAVVALVAIGGGATATAAKKGKGKRGQECKPAKNIEAIIDDSGSMSSSDPDKLRVDLLRAVNGSLSGQLGAVEFGSTAASLFPPTPMPVPLLAQTTPDTIKTIVDSDNGGTTYASGFTQGKIDNPKADARIFLSDGAPSDSTQTVHKNPNIRTIVVGTGPLATDTTALAVLQKIAKDTGGPPPILIANAADIPAGAAKVIAGLLCAGKAQTIGVDAVAAAGQTFTHVFRPKRRKATVLTTWPTTGVDLNITSSRGSAIPSEGGLFSSLRLRGLKAKKPVTITVTAAVVPPATTTTATTQVIK